MLYHQFELEEGGKETLNNMVYNTEHAIYTLAFDKFDEPGGIASVHAKTTEYPGQLFTFDVSDLTQTSAHIKLTPAIKDMTYTYTLTKKAKYESDLEKNDGDNSNSQRVWLLSASKPTSNPCWVHLNQFGYFVYPSRFWR